MRAYTRREAAGVLAVFGVVAVEVGVAYPGLLPHMAGTAAAFGVGAASLARSRERASEPVRQP